MISFGLLNVPISLQSAERRVDLHFRMIDSRSQKPIRYERVNAETGEEVPWKDIVQAFEYQKGNYVVLSKEEISAAASQHKESIDIDAFVDRNALSPLYFEKPYYLVPGKKAEKGYALLRTILQKTERAGIGYVLIRTRRYLAAVLAEGDALILNLLRFDQEVVSADNFIFPSHDLDDLHISAREITMATQLVDSMTVDWNATSYRDDYRDQLIKIVEQRVAEKQGLVREEPEEEAPAEAATNVVDFMALLKASLRNKNKPETEHTTKVASQNPATKKQVEKKSAAKKTPVKKTTAKKSSSAASATSKKTDNNSNRKSRRAS
jgi:DNA end-binding protein Ku